MPGKKLAVLIIPIAILGAVALYLGHVACSHAQEALPATSLPEPQLEGDMSLEECLAVRRSLRSYDDRPLTMDEISQVLWAAQGITVDWGARTAPSAGGLFPLKLFLFTGDVEGLDAGVYYYDPNTHALGLVAEGDFLTELSSAALDQASVATAPAVLVITAIPSITEAKYGDRSMRYIDTETGAVCQNVYLQCEALGLGAVAVGAFHDDRVAELTQNEVEPRLIMPFGARG